MVIEELCTRDRERQREREERRQDCFGSGDNKERRRGKNLPGAVLVGFEIFLGCRNSTYAYAVINHRRDVTPALLRADTPRRFVNPGRRPIRSLLQLAQGSDRLPDSAFRPRLAPLGMYRDPFDPVNRANNSHHFHAEAPKPIHSSRLQRGHGGQWSAFAAICSIRSTYCTMSQNATRSSGAKCTGS